jgi:DNA-binding MarR family transcriptional regulator
MPHTRKTAVSPLEAHLGFWLRFVSNHVSQAFARKVESRGVTVAEWVALRELYQHKSALASELAIRLGMTRGGVSKLVDRLERKALVSRATREGDARYQSLTLTKAGRDLVPVLAALADQNDAAFFGHLDAQAREKLTDVMKDIVRRQELRAVPID